MEDVAFHDLMIDAAINKMCTRGNDKACWYCHKVKEDIMICSKCNIARYCDILCQKQHWKQCHKICCVIHEEDIDDAAYTDNNLTRSTDLFTKATNYFSQNNYIKAERLYKNLMVVLRNVVRDRQRVMRLLNTDFHAGKNLAVDCLNDIMSYTATIHNLACTCEHLNKHDEVELST